MKVKTFTGATIDEALAAIKEDLGDSVLILETRTRANQGLAGMLGRRQVEVIVADDATGEADADPSTPIISTARLLDDDDDPLFGNSGHEKTPSLPIERHGPIDLLVGDSLSEAAPSTDQPHEFFNGNVLARPSNGMPDAALPSVLDRICNMNLAAKETAPAPGPKEYQSPQFAHLGANLSCPEEPVTEITERFSLDDVLPQESPRGPWGQQRVPNGGLPAAPRDDFDPQPPAQEATFPAAYQTLFEHLVRQDLPEPLAHSLIKQILSSKGKKASLAEIKSEIRKAFKEALRPEPISSGQIEPSLLDAVEDEFAKSVATRCVAFIGPAGAGKSSALAKIAAHFSLKERRSVGLITIDHSSIEEPDRVKAYGELMGVPTRRVRTPMQFVQAIEELRNRDYIFIDTPACTGEFNAEKLESFFHAVGDSFEKHLVLSATTRLRDLLAARETYQPLGAGRLLFTRMDETSALGHLIELARKTHLPLSYFSTGQEIPDDLKPASGEALADRILEGT